MNEYAIVVYESSSCWSAALRVTIARNGHALCAIPTVHETRSLPELRAKLADVPDSLAMIEVRSTNLQDVLSLISGSQLQRCPQRFVALLRLSDWPPHRPTALVRDALRAAGAMEVVDSPRQLRPVLGIGERLAGTRRAIAGTDDSPLLEWARRRLPWQDARQPIG